MAYGDIKMRVLLINPAIRLDDDPKNVPLGLAYIAKMLQREGHSVEVLDINAYRFTWDETVAELQSKVFDVIGLTGIVTQYNALKDLARKVKALYPDKKIILGGPLVSAAPETVLKNIDVDIGIIGEGELTSVDLINTLEKGGGLENVNGICFKAGSEIIKTEPRDLIKNLDDIPSPAWELFPMHIYLKHHNLGYGSHNSINITTERGCPFHCTFCYDAFQNQARLRSPENIITELKELKRKFNIKSVHFCDETFTLNRERTIKICKMMIEEKLDLSWATLARVNLVDEELLGWMKKAGCMTLSFGVESGNQDNLNKIRKGTTVEQGLKAIKITRKAGITPDASFMIGIPGETLESIQDSVKFCKKTKFLLQHFFFFTPIPGSESYRNALGKGLIKDEDAYLSQLKHGEFGKELLINLSTMSDEGLIKARLDAEKKITRNFYLSYWYKMPSFVYRYIKNTGIVGLFKRINYELKRIRGRHEIE